MAPQVAVVGLLLITLIPIPACTNRPADRDRADLNSLATYYMDYVRSNRRPPKDKATLQAFIESIPLEHRQRNNAEDVESLFVSPRDGQPYEVVYGEATGGRVPDVIAFEAVGAEGNRWVARSLGYVTEATPAEFEELFRGQP